MVSLSPDPLPLTPLPGTLLRVWCGGVGCCPADAPRDDLKLQLEVYGETILLRGFENDAAWVRTVSADEMANVFTQHLGFSSGRIVGAQSTVRRSLGRARRLMPLAAALLLAALLAIPASNIAQAQAPPGNELTLVNADREFVERKGGGEFVARPVFDREIANLFYAVRDADTGDWISAMYRVKGGEKKRSDGWEYSWEYPDLDDHPELDRDYLLVMLAEAEDGLRGDFYAVIPIHQPGRIWDKILSALSPARWAKAFAGWVIEGVHGTLCGVVERASGEDADNCRGG